MYRAAKVIAIASLIFIASISHADEQVFQAAIKRGNMERVRAMLKENPDLVNQPGADGATPLYWAATQDDYKLAEFLIKHGADANKKNEPDPGGYSGFSPLFAVTFNQDTSIALLLINNGADVNAQMEPLGYSPLWTAVSLKNEPLEKLLIEHGAKETPMVADARQPDELKKDLFQTIIDGDVKKIEQMLDKNPELLHSRIGLGTLLFFACETGNREVAAFLIARGADVNERSCGHDIFNATPLHVAVLYMDAELVKLLLENGADVNVVSAEPEGTPLLFAVKSGNKEIEKLLLAHGAVVTEKVEQARPPSEDEQMVHSAVLYADLSAVSGMIEQNPKLLEARNEEQFTVLDSAAKEGHLEMVKFLIAKGADVNAEDNSNGTPVRWAACNGSIEIVKELIKAGADLDPSPGKVESPLQCAAGAGHKDVVELLLKHGADINGVDKQGRTGLMDAVSRDRMNVARLLIDKGADVNARDKRGNTALIDALDEDDDSYIRLLLNNGADPNLEDNYLDTPLKRAAGKGNAKYVALLIEHGADVNLCNERRETPLMTAAYRDLFDTAKLLLDNHADVDRKNRDGKTAMDIAIEKKNNRIAELLKNRKDAK